MLHRLVEHVHIFRSPTSGIVTFWHVPFGALDETEHIRRVYFNSGESEKESMTVKQYLISDICKYFRFSHDIFGIRTDRITYLRGLTYKSDQG